MSTGQYVDYDKEPQRQPLKMSVNGNNSSRRRGHLSYTNKQKIGSHKSGRRFSMQIDVMSMRHLFLIFMAALLAESFLVWVGAGTALATSLGLVATSIAFGLIILALTLFFGAYGSHINPGISIMFYFYGYINWREMLAGVFGAMVGGILGGLWLLLTFSGIPSLTFGVTNFDPNSTGWFTIWHGVLVESLGSWILFWAAIRYANHRWHQVTHGEDRRIVGKTIIDESEISTGLYFRSLFNWSHFAFLMGFLFVALEFVGINVSGGSYNIARTFGTSLLLGSFTNSWHPYVGFLVGLFLAWLSEYVHEWLHHPDKQNASDTTDGKE